MLDLEWSPDAVDDLDLIWDIIAQDDVDAADVFIDRLRDEARDICRIPKKGHIITEFENENFREVYFKGYTIVYEIREEYILIHEVYNQKRIFIRAYKR